MIYREILIKYNVYLEKNISNFTGENIKKLNFHRSENINFELFSSSIYANGLMISFSCYRV